MEKAHFDTEHFNHIVWTQASELRQRLALRIQATVGFVRPRALISEKP